MQISFRYATLDDVPVLTDDLAAMFASAVRDSWDLPNEIDRVGIQNHLTLHLQSGHRIMLAVADGQIVGALAILVKRLFWLTGEVLGEEGLFIKPAYRRTRIAQSLIKWAIEVSDSMKLPLLMSQATGIKVEQVDALYERAGLRRIGGNFLYTPK